MPKYKRFLEYSGLFSNRIHFGQNKTLCQRPRGDHPIKVQLQREFFDLEAPDSSEIDRTAGHIFLDFSKMRLKDVHALQKLVIVEIIVRGSTLQKHVKNPQNTISKIKEKIQRTK